MNLVYLWYMYEDIYLANILYSIIPAHSLGTTWAQDQGHGLRIFMLKFYIKLVRSSVFKKKKKKKKKLWRIWFIRSTKIENLMQYHPHPLHDHGTGEFLARLYEVHLELLQLHMVPVIMTTLKFYVQVFQKFVSRQRLTGKNSHLDHKYPVVYST